MFPSHSLHFLNLYSHYCCKPPSDLIHQLPGLLSDSMHIYTAWLKLTLFPKFKFLLVKIFIQLRGYITFSSLLQAFAGRCHVPKVHTFYPLIFHRVLISLTYAALRPRLERNMLIGQIDSEEKSDGILIVNPVEMELVLRNHSPTFAPFFKTICM